MWTGRPPNVHEPHVYQKQPWCKLADFGLAEATASGGRSVGDVLQSSQWLNYPAYDYAANSNGGYYFATQGGGTAADETSYYARVFRGTNFSRAIPYDFEMRFV